MEPTDAAFRTTLRAVLARSGRSMRGLSAAMGRDPGYIAALLDPTRPSRARPTPADLLSASDVTGISFVELLESLWGIDRGRLVDELGRLGVDDLDSEASGALTPAERAEVADFAAFVRSRRQPARGAPAAGRPRSGQR
jgi:hypothetical protein